jgi:hypothetical protein
VTPLLLVAGSTWFVANTLVSRTAKAGAGILFLLPGILVYYLWKKRAAPPHTQSISV